MTGSAEGSDGHPNQAQPVLGITIFWILLALCIASSWHPLGSNAGLPSKIRRHVRILPLTVLFDTVLLYGEFVHHILKDGQHRSTRDLARRVAIRRLRTNTALPDKIRNQDDFVLLGEGNRPEFAEGTNATWWLKTVILFIGVDLRPRLLSNMLVVLLYTKLHAFQGTPISLTMASLYFISWVGNEIFLFALYGIVWARSPQQLFALIDRDDNDDDDDDHQVADEANPLPRATKPPVGLQSSRLVTLANRILLAVQVAGFITFAIWVIASRSPRPTPPQLPPPQQPDLSPPSSSWIMTVIMLGVSIVKWLATPSIWWFEHVGEPVMNSGIVGRLFYVPPILAIVLYFTVLGPATFLGLPALAVGTCLFIAPFFLAYLGFMAALCMHEEIHDNGGYVNILAALVLGILGLFMKLLSVVFSPAAVVGWAWAGSLSLLSATLVYYTVFWDSGGTSKAPWGEYLG